MEIRPDGGGQYDLIRSALWRLGQLSTENELILFLLAQTVVGVKVYLDFVFALKSGS